MPTFISENVEGPSTARQHLHREEDLNLLDYLQTLATDTPIKVTVIRELPKTWEGRSIEGTLESFEEPISEEEIRELFGGGKYKLVIYTPNTKGSWQYATARKIKIAGDPILKGLITTAAATPKGAETPSTVHKVMEMSQQMIAQAQARADRAEERGQPKEDPALKLVMQELAAVRTQLADKDSRMFELMNASSPADALLGKMVDGESARMQSLRQQIDSEIRVKNDMHRSEIDRLHSRYEDIAKRQEDSNKREIDNLVRSNENQLVILRSSYEGQIEGYKREISHLDRQLTTSQKEVVQLRATKEKGLLESMTEMAAMKDALETFGGGKDESSTLERVVQGVLGSSLAEGMASRLAGGSELMAPGPASGPEPEPEMPFDQPVQLPDGRVLVRKRDGTVVEIRRKPKATNSSGSKINVPDEDVLKAVQFMELALANDSNPSEFARSARNMAPAPVLSMLREQGVDAFLELVSKLSPGSPLLQQHGKNWSRKVAAALLE